MDIKINNDQKVDLYKVATPVCDQPMQGLKNEWNNLADIKKKKTPQVGVVCVFNVTPARCSGGNHWGVSPKWVGGTECFPYSVNKVVQKNKILYQIQHMCHLQ